MNTNTINAALCAKMFVAGARNLESKKEWINELNVFPVPDGDTGTNMTLTIMSAVKEVSALESLTMETLARAVSSGSLRGARGNSGVILSQLLRGFTKVIRTEEEITPVVLTAALQKAVETAYKAVMKPKEGTILTVARGGAERATELLEENPDIELDALMKEVISRSEEVLAQTPELLPVLKEAGVVDSGGQGLVQVMKGAYDAFTGAADTEVPTLDEAASEGGFSPHSSDVCAGSGQPSDGRAASAQPADENSYVSSHEAAPSGAMAENEPDLIYRTEFTLCPDCDFTDEVSIKLRTYLEAIGDMVRLTCADGRVSIHLHTNDPGHALQRALKLGSLTDIQILNRRMESSGISEDTKMEDMKETGFISVSIGDGIGDIFRELGVDCLIEGGQTMNPSTEDMLNAIAQVKAKNIFILPNNKNIILAANQAKSLTKDKNIFVIPTRTIPQGITAVISFVPEKSPVENAAIMEQEIDNVKTGQVTYAVRDTHIEDKVISAGDIMGVGDHSILAVGKDTEVVAEEMTARMMTDEAELISIYYGEDMKEEEADTLRERLSELYPDCDVELNYGGQPIYYYIISIE